MIFTRALAAASVLLASATAAAQATPNAQATVRYSYIVAGQLAGHYERMKTADGAYNFRLEYRAGSSKVSFDTQVKFDDQWFPIRLQTRGRDAAGHEVAETFAMDSGIASWKTLLTSGSAFAAPVRFYSSANPSFDEMRALVLAGRASHDGCVELLPTGRACVRKVTEIRVAAGGAEATVHAWAISGVNSRPLLVWLDDKTELFAAVTAWSSAILEGWESLEDHLLDAQDRWLEQEAVRRASRATVAPDGGSMAHADHRPILH